MRTLTAHNITVASESCECGRKGVRLTGATATCVNCDRLRGVVGLRFAVVATTPHVTQITVRSPSGISWVDSTWVNNFDGALSAAQTYLAGKTYV